MVGRVLLYLSAIAVFHAAFAAYEYLSHLKALGMPERPLPRDIILEALLALVLGTIGASLSAAPLKEISWASEMRKRSIDEMDARSGFASYVTRGTSFLVLKSSSTGETKKDR